jgi:hypothetical protein
MTTPITVRADSLTPGQIGGRLKIVTETGAVVEDVLMGIIAAQYPDFAAAFEGKETSTSPTKMRVGLQFANARPTKTDRTERDHFFLDSAALVEVVS